MQDARGSFLVGSVALPAPTPPAPGTELLLALDRIEDPGTLGLRARDPGISCTGGTRMLWSTQNFASEALERLTTNIT